MDRVEKASKLFYSGLNCAQSVALTFDDILPITRANVSAVASPFGGGFSRTRNLCGALSGVGIVLGLLEQGTGDIADDKKNTYESIRAITDKFLEKNGSLICSELLSNIDNITTDYVPSKRDEEYYKARPCIRFVVDCVRFIEQSQIYKDVIQSKITLQ